MSNACATYERPNKKSSMCADPAGSAAAEAVAEAAAEAAECCTAHIAQLSSLHFTAFSISISSSPLSSLLPSKRRLQLDYDRLANESDANMHHISYTHIRNEQGERVDHKNGKLFLRNHIITHFSRPTK